MNTVWGRSRRLLAVVALAVSAAGCDDGRSGPGRIDTSLSFAAGGAPGAALVEIRGASVRGAEGTDGTRSWIAPTPDGLGYRVLLVDPAPAGAMTFGIDVEDLSDPLPTVSIVELADRDNEPLPPTMDLRVTFRR